MALRVGDRVIVTKQGAASYGKHGTVKALADSTGKLSVELDPVTIKALESSLTLENPVPDPDPEPEPRLDSFRGYADGLPARYAPFSKDSPFNRPVPPALHPRSAQMIANLPWSGKPGNITVIPDDARDVQHPIFFARDTDPVYRIVCSGSSNGQEMRIPDNATWARGSDGHMQVVQPDGRSRGCWRVTKIDKSLKTITCTYCYWQRYDGLGCVPYKTGAVGEGGTTASYFDQDAGIIRARQMYEGRIEHGLFLVVKYLSRDTPNVWPAFKADQMGSSGVELPSMGDRLMLDCTESEIRNQTGVPAWEKTIQVAMAEFGGWCGDTGGPGLGLMAESKLSPGALAYWRAFVEREKIPYVSGYGYTLTPKSALWATKLKVAERATP